MPPAVIFRNTTRPHSVICMVQYVIVYLHDINLFLKEKIVLSVMYELGLIYNLY